MRSLRGKLTYANVVASLALFLAIGGVSYAATQMPKNSVGTKQLKNNAVTTAKIKNGAVTGAKIKLASLGSVPNADQAANATRANQAASATTATNATNAAHADSADNSARLGGLGPASFVQSQARSGDVLTGQLAEHFEGGADGEFFVAGDSYRSALPASTPVPQLVYTESSTPQCPEVGKASPGILCVYGYNTSNLNIVEESGDFEDPNYHYGFSLDLFPGDETEEGYFLASWAYRVP